MKNRVHASMPRRIDRFDVGTAPVLLQLSDFAAALRQRAFPKVVQAIVPSEAKEGTSVELVAQIADAMHVSRRRYDVLEKSLQETLFSIGDFDFDQKPFGRNVQSFVRTNGAKGVIQLFLEMYLSNVVLKQLHDSQQMPDSLEVLESLPDGIQGLCRQAVKATTDSWTKWPELDSHWARQLLHDLRSELCEKLPQMPVFSRAG